MKAAVLGSPIAHSLSPVLHTAGYAAAGLDEWSYHRFEVRAEELAGFLAGMDDEWRGFSLTMPLKQVCLEVAGEITDVARRAAAGNTLLRRDGSWLADNTDVGGLVDALRPHGTGGAVAILGAGATARSAVLAVAELGADQVTCYARDLGKAEALADWAQAVLPRLVVRTGPLAEGTTGGEPTVLSTLPAGAADGLVFTDRRAGLLFDAVYADWPTRLARSASAAGMHVIGGLELLVHQAGRQFELFTGLPAPLEAMFAAGRAALEAPAPVEPVETQGSGATPVEPVETQESRP